MYLDIAKVVFTLCGMGALHHVPAQKNSVTSADLRPLISPLKCYFSVIN
jgi:hypothetical protein